MGKYMNKPTFILVDKLHNDCKYEAKRLYQNSVSSILMRNGIANSFFCNAKQKYHNACSEHKEGIGVVEKELFERVITIFQLNREDYIIPYDTDKQETEEEPVNAPATEEPSGMESIVEVLKRTNEILAEQQKQIEMLGKLLVQNHIDIGELKEAWK